jgi:Cu-Zn family superoxide dismutase
MKKWMVVLALLACAAFSRPVAAQTGDLHATVELKDTNGQSVGTAHLMQDGDAVHVTGSFRNLPPGAHGIHFHAVGTCEPDFAAAGGHYNPEGKQHGLENPAGAHAGDLPNLMINDDGTGSYDHKTMMVTLGSGPTTLYDADGTSIIIHAGPDDYRQIRQATVEHVLPVVLYPQHRPQHLRRSHQPAIPQRPCRTLAAHRQSYCF